MHKAKSVNKNKSARHLKLVSTDSTSLMVEQPTSCPAKLIDYNEINFLTQVMMNRLWIPQSTTIVGLLNVGASKDNFEELSKWIATEQTMISNDHASDDLQYLEKRFRDSVACFPEN